MIKYIIKRKRKKKYDNENMSSYNLKKNYNIKKYTIDKYKYLFSKNFSYYYLLKAIIINITIAFSLPFNYNYLTIRLNNGNFLVISDNGLFIFDPTFTNSTKINGVNYTDDISFNLAHFSEEDGGYILFITEKYNYVLFPNGTLFNAISSHFFYEFLYFDQYSVIPYIHYNDSYYYFVLFLNDYDNDYNYYYITKYEFFISNKTIQYIPEFLYYTDYCYNLAISCQLMKFNDINAITCFFLAEEDLFDDYNYINVKVFDPENYFTIIQSSNSTILNSSDIIFFKSAIMTVNKRQKALLCSPIILNSSLYLFSIGYDISSNFLYEKYILCPNNCKTNNVIFFDFTLSYFRETEEFITSILCNLPSNIYLLYSFDNNFNYSFLGSISNYIIDYSNSYCYNFPTESNIFHHILFSSLAQKYFVLWEIIHSVF